MNILRTGILMAAMTALFLVVGYAIGGQTGMAIAFVFAAGSNLFAYWNSDKMVLRAYGAQPLDPSNAPELYGIVSELAQSAGIPTPRLYMIDSDTPNAFATGRNPRHAAVAVTRGIMRICDREEGRRGIKPDDRDNTAVDDPCKVLGMSHLSPHLG